MFDSHTVVDIVALSLGVNLWVLQSIGAYSKCVRDQVEISRLIQMVEILKLSLYPTFLCTSTTLDKERDP